MKEARLGSFLFTYRHRHPHRWSPQNLFLGTLSPRAFLWVATLDFLFPFPSPLVPLPLHTLIITTPPSHLHRPVIKYLSSLFLLLRPLHPLSFSSPIFLFSQFSLSLSLFSSPLPFPSSISCPPSTRSPSRLTLSFFPESGKSILRRQPSSLTLLSTDSCFRSIVPLRIAGAEGLTVHDYSISIVD